MFGPECHSERVEGTGVYTLRDKTRPSKVYRVFTSYVTDEDGPHCHLTVAVIVRLHVGGRASEVRVPLLTLLPPHTLHGV